MFELAELTLAETLQSNSSAFGLASSVGYPGTAEVADDLGRLQDEHPGRSTPNTGLILSNDRSPHTRRVALDPMQPPVTFPVNDRCTSKD